MYIGFFADNDDGDEVEWPELLENVLRSGCYGNNLTLFAASNAFLFDYAVLCPSHTIDLLNDRFDRKFHFVFDGTGIGFNGHYSATCSVI